LPRQELGNIYYGKNHPGNINQVNSSTLKYKCIINQTSNSNRLMQYSIKRYDLRKNLIATGMLIVRSEGQTTHLTYADSEIKESVSELYHPIVALES
jgi:hypothetical protein